MLKITIGQGVTLTDINQEIYDKVLTDLTLKNPEYEEAKKKGRYIPVSMSKYISYWEYDENNDSIWFPRGYFVKFRKWLKQSKIPYKFKDDTLLLKRINIPFKGTLRKYQIEAVNDLRRLPIGILEAKVGSGKTVMAINVITKRKQPTLIIVHSKELLYQWQSAIKKFLDYDCGLVGDGKFDIKPITVGIINTVRNRLNDLINKFGHIICDEVHRIAASSWSVTLQEFPARYYLGLSATVYRKSDMTGRTIYLNIGPKLHSVDQEMLFKSGAILKPKIKRIYTDFRFIYRNNYSAMISVLSKDTERNKIIIREIKAEYRLSQGTILVISDRKGHCLFIQKELQRLNIKSEVLLGSLSKKERKLFNVVKLKKREEVVQEVRDGKCRLLISTSSLIGEGFDVPNLNTLFLTTPIKFKGRLDQVTGRILRPKKGKKPKIVDFRDNEINVLRYQGYSRDRTYKELWGV